MKKILLILAFISTSIYALPPGFVYLKTIDPSIQQEMRYAGSHNFVGRPIKGYEAAQCILTKPAALALHRVQMELNKLSLSLKVYDCYRPQRAVNDFIAWSKVVNDQRMKAEFYPNVDKADFFKLGYVATKSGHTRGSTVDLTIIPLPVPKQEKYTPLTKLRACFDPQRFGDNSIAMGTGYDCLDKQAHIDNMQLSKQTYKNRQLLLKLMTQQGFVPYEKEWWHFTFQPEPYPHNYFDFMVT